MEKFLKKEVLAPLIIILVAYIFYRIIKAIIKKSFKIAAKRRDERKTKTIMMLFINIVKVLLFVIVTIMILDIYGINVKSLLASLGVFAAVAALATQDLLKDFIAGISIILESQYRIGDIVTIDGFKGEVIFLSLKTTKIESYTGEVKIIANHNINNVVNHSITDSLAIVDVSVAYDSDLEKVEKVLVDLSKDLSTKIPELKGDIEVLGVQELADSAVVYRLTALTEAMQQLGVQRQILRAVKVAFDENDIEIPFPQVVVHNG